MLTTCYGAKMLRMLCTLVLTLTLSNEPVTLFAQQPADPFINTHRTVQATTNPGAARLEMVGYLPGVVWQVVANQRIAVALTAGDLVVFDIRNPAQPRIMSRLLLRSLPSGSGGGQPTLAMAGHYVYLACADHCGNTSLFVINVAVPTSPVVVGRLKTETTLSYITVAGNRLYGSLNGEFAIIDLQEPTAPKLLSVQPLPGQFAHATNSVIMESANGARYAFVTSLNGKLSIVDVTEPTAPQVVATYAPDQACINDAVLLSDGNRPRLYLTDCYAGVRVLDVTTPTHPQALPSYNFGQENTAYRITVTGQRLLVATDVAATSAWDSTLRILDSSSGTLTESGSFDFVYTYALAPLGPTLLLADVQRGVQFLDIHTPTAIQEVGRQPVIDAIRDLASDGRYLYTASANGLSVLDPLNLTTLAYVVEVPTPYALTIKVMAGLALMTDYEGGLWLFNVQNPIHPVVVSHSTTPILNTTALVISGTLGSQATAFLGGIGCTPFSCQPSLAAVDLSNLQQPVTTVLLPDGRGISALAQVGNLLYMTTGSPSTLTPSDLLIFDITAPMHPNEIGQLPLPAAAASLAVTDHALYVALTNALQTYDISNPTVPRHTQTTKLSWGLESITVDQDFLYGKDRFDLTVFSLAEPLQPAVQEKYALPSGGGSIVANNILVDHGAIYVINNGLTVWRPQEAEHGYVRDAWGEPYAGAGIYDLGKTNAAARDLILISYSGLTGGYSLPTTLGESHSIQAIVDGYSVWSPTRTDVTRAPVTGENFYVLTKPVSVTVQPSTAASLSYMDDRALKTAATIPAGTVDLSTLVQLTPLMAFDQAQRHFTGNGFALSLTDSANGAPLDTLRQPISITIQYSDQGNNALLDESSLQLLIEVEDQWQPLPNAAITRDLAANSVTIAVPKPGRYALFGATNSFYLPLITQK